MKTEILRADHPVNIQHAIDILRNGGIVAFPTDTVYGLAVLPFQEEVVERLYSAKGRNSARAIAILIGNVADLPRLASVIDQRTECLARNFWPGPLTLILPGIPSLPRALSQNGTIGVRMPDHPVAMALLQKIGPLAVTSANLSGGDNTNSAREVMAQMKGRIHLVLDGGMVSGGVPSTVVDCTGPELVVVREGPIQLEAIQSALVAQ
ncbi:MAG: threonylcarbamoyl-AMP synthase [Anaerolineales bacterium]|nr:threonylcarbamoyl-AMP synthase [Anaerolineales bacterium]